MQKMIIVDAAKCTGCRTCEQVCSAKKEGVVNPMKARIRICRFEDIVFEVPVFCQQCADAPCKTVCPVSAISRNEETGIVIVDTNRCIGCKMCVTICPFGAMGFDVKTGTVFKCDQCNGEPTCVKFCDTKAIDYVKVTDANMRKRVEGAQKVTELIPTDVRMASHLSA
jgi:carbon-monoxide dehydrogenase iron sulfur subunit